MFELIDLFPIFFFLMFAIVFGTIIVTAVKGVREKRANDASPVLEVEATVVTKRADVNTTAHQEWMGEEPTTRFTSNTTYYVTFQVRSGDRMEFQVSDQAYGMLVEGDSGTLTFQGNRYLGFARAGAEEI